MAQQQQVYYVQGQHVVAQPVQPMYQQQPMYMQQDPYAQQPQMYQQQQYHGDQKPMAPPQHAPPMHRGGGAMTVIGQRDPVHITCPSCRQNSYTSVKFETTGKQWVACCCLGWFTGCCCIPFLFKDCYLAKHFCGNCGQYFGSSGS